ncbi:uncharacterized protein LOC120639746 [Panicum virgatum]|uniref:DUF4220 domain-containing protein n=1 Tax=Panicum virgatum TaxID=38727 RepID=A0A8T0QDJ3_PANVG|nr:uncharacterized protein LOC120639746 [Panicum virgatum]KAG2570642.1 hypothetical protein PVAP13_7KG077745 [Panicum virgatum]
MSGIWSAVRWWDEWQMRVLVAASLLIQWFLLLAAPMRKYTIGTWLRWLIWLAYISCDALAIYALATLFNRQTKASNPCYTGARASYLEVLWAPVLLIHLGGREEITAYHIEDNEMWTRHTVTLVSQVTVALYAFYKTWPDSGDRRLLWSAVVLFFIGILSFCEKPWALRRASINRLVSVYSSLAAGERQKPTSAWEYLFTELDFGGGSIVRMKKKPRSTILSDGDKVQMILSDMSLGAAAAAAAQKNPGLSKDDVLGTLDPGAEKNMKSWLRRAFGLIYTRANVVSTPAYLACHVLLVPTLHATAIALFAMSHKHAYEQFNAADVKMTYVILSFTAVLDVFGVPISELLYWVLSKTKIPALCEMLPGDNLIDAVQKVKNPRTGRLIKWARSLGYKGRFFHRDNRSNNLYGKVAGFVVAELLGDKVQGLDLASYRDIDKKKNWALKKLEVLFINTDTAIWKSLRQLPFDESVLRWHIATDLCCRLSPPPKGLNALTYTHSKCAAEISNYMAHLLNCRPDMLMTGSRQHLFNEALRSMGSMGRVVWRSIDDAKDACSKHALIKESWNLAKELVELGDDKTRWEIMYRVWVGLLCYSASMCRGYQHAKSLGEGGEFLSFVWLVIALKGAKTLADKLQMPDDEGATPGAAQEATQGIDLSKFD